MERTIRQVEIPVPIQPRLKRVAAYARVSSGKDAMLHSLSAQVSYYSQLIQSHEGWQYCGVFSDEAFTGTKENREGFQRLLAECRAGHIDLLITKSISRFARNTVTLLQTVRELKLLGVDVYFEEQNIHTMSADGELMMTILASYAQEESLSASENQKWRIRKGFENGELVNLRYLFGYRIRKGSIEVDPVNGAIVQEVFLRAIAGETFGSICRDLDSRGVKGVLGGHWSVQRIRDILSNEKYTGNALLQKTFVNNHLEKTQVKNNGELPMYYAEGTHSAIIDQQTFQEAQRLLQRLAKQTQGRAKRKTSVLSSRIRCGKCGQNFIQVTSNGTPGWNCMTYQKQGKSACSAKKIPDSTLKRVTAELLGTADFDAQAFSEAIAYIEVPDSNLLRFVFHDGHTEERHWADRSRAESWTPEMKEAARAKAMQRRMNK